MKLYPWVHWLRSLAPLTHSLAPQCSLRSRSAALIPSFARSLTHSGAHGKGVFAFELNASISKGFNPLCGLWTRARDFYLRVRRRGLALRARVSARARAQLPRRVTSISEREREKSQPHNSIEAWAPRVSINNSNIIIDDVNDINYDHPPLKLPIDWKMESWWFSPAHST